MSLTAAAGGFVIFLLSVQVIQGQNVWGVTYSSTQICAVKGSAVEIRCSYTHPSRRNDGEIKVNKTFWFTKMKNGEHVDLTTDPEYSGRVQYRCDKNKCTLTIRNLRESDSAEYMFRVITNSSQYTGEPGVTLTVTGNVTDPELKVRRWYFGWLYCFSSCRLPNRPSYIWYKNGEKIQAETSDYLSNPDPADSYSCALKGYEDFPSPSVCFKGDSCNRITYTDRTICAPRGSSVNMSFIYNKYNHSDKSTFWFSSKGDQQTPSDLSEDSQYAGRVQVIETERGRSTLTISDLTDSDSAQYLFKFRAPSFEWSSLPGTTLTVTALQVQVISVTVLQYYTKAYLKCHSSCSPTARLSYVWFKNGEEIQRNEYSMYYGAVDPRDIISCALKGHEDHRSPSVYAPKLPSVSVSPAEIVEGSSVTLTCSSDANPAAKYTWYKENRNLNPLSEEPQLVFSSIQSSDSGQYYCTAENKLGKTTSGYTSIDVKYAPKLPSVSVSPSEIVEGSSVTLTCSSDANPAANYTWYKEDEDSPKASGQMFTITDFRAEHSGNYYCEAQNTRGQQTNSVHLTVWAGKSTAIMNIIRFTLVAVMPIPLLLYCLWIRKKKARSSTAEAIEMTEVFNTPTEGGSQEEESDHDYINALPLNTLTAAETEDTEEQDHLV